MKKIITMFTFLFIVTIGMFGQGSAIIGTGTSTSNGSIADPVERYYNYEHFQMLYTAAELSAAGIPSGASITALGFSISESAVSLANYQIDMVLTTLTAPPVSSGFTTVKTPFTYTPVVQVAGSFDMITFNTPFTWDGTSNLVINTCTGSNPFTTPYGGLRYTSTTPTYRTKYMRTDGSSNCGNYSLVTQTYNRPNIRLDWTPGNNCSGTPDPQNTLSSANPVCSGVNFTLSVQNPPAGSGVTYQWQSSPDGNDPWTNLGTSGSYVTSQTTATFYRCQVTCAGNTGTSTPLQVTMNPFLNCYCTSMASNAADEEIYSVTVGGATNAYDCFTVAPGAGSILNRYSNFHPLGSLANLPKGTTVSFTVLEDECDGAAYYSNGCAIWIDFNQDGDFTDAGEQVYSEATTTISPRTINGGLFIDPAALLGVTAMRITVAEGYSGAGLTPCLAYGYGETEDYLVTITEPPACPPPYALGVDNLTSTSANLFWTPGGSETQWEYVYGLAPLPAPSGSGTVTNSSTINPIGPLTANTNYQYYVRAICATKAQSAWAGPFSFTTLCGTFVAPLCEVFQATSIPLCWSTAGGVVGTQTWVFTNTWPAYGAAGLADHTGTSGSFAGVDGSGSAGIDSIMLTTPLIDKSGMTSVQLRFYVFNNNTSTVNLADEQEMVVQVWDGISGWQNIYTWPFGKNNANWEEVVVPLGVYGNPFQLRFMVAKGTGLPFYDDMIIDDLCIEEIPSCPVPINLTAVPAGFQAILDWQETGLATTWDIEYGATPYTFTGTPTFTGVTKPYTLLGLTPSTGYVYKVRSNCGATNSGWSVQKTFTTTVACPAPTGLNVTGILETSAKLGWIESGTATEWDIELVPSGAIPTGTPTVENVVDNPYTYGGLSAATCYDFYVRADCGGTTGTSTWAGPFTFCTSCGVLTIPYCQDFATAAFPACWSQSYTGTLTSNRWSMSNSANAGGAAYEAMNSWQSGIGVSSMFSPSFNTTGLTTVKLSFRSQLNDYGGGGVGLKVQARLDGGAWGDIWTQAAGIGDVTEPAHVVDVTIPVTGTSTLELLWAVDGDHYNIDYWYVDDACLSISVALDAETVSIDDVPSFSTPGTPISPKATVKNSGTTGPITFDVTMTATDGYSSTVYGVSLASGASTQVTFANWTPALGDWVVTVCTQLTGDETPSNDCRTKAVSIQNLRKVYAYVAYGGTSGLPEGPGYFYVQYPGAITSLAATTSAQFIGAGCYADGVWYGSEYYDATALSGGGWWSIDTLTGAMTLIADFDMGFAGIAFNKNTQVLYGTNYTGTGNDLYTIDRLTGTPTLLGTITGFASGLLINLASDGSAFLYAIDLGGDNLYKIDPVTQIATLVGPVGFAMNYAQDMEYDYDYNKMYACAYTSTGQFLEINTTTGAGTLIGNFQGGAEMCGFAIPYSTAAPPKNVSLKVYLEGLYNGTGNNQAYNEVGPQWTYPIADKVDIELRSSVDGSLVLSINNVNLNVDGSIDFTVDASYNGNYYIYIYNRNHLVTSTAVSFDFALPGAITYDMSTGVGQAFGGNMKDIGGVAVIYGGDAVLDGLVDSTDMIACDNDAAAFATGYIATDADGNGLVDSSDMILIDNNSAAFVASVLPF